MNMRSLFLFIFLLALLSNCKDDEVTLSSEEQLQKDIEIIDAWTAANAINAKTDPSGLRYTITKIGVGAKPKLTNKVVVRYSGKFLKEGVPAGNSVVHRPKTVQVARTH